MPSLSLPRPRLTYAIGCCALVAIGLGLLSPPLAAAPDEAGALRGDLVSVGSHRLHLFCQGTGRPTVILEAGIGGNYLDWALVQPEIGRFTRVCSYDRAGVGWSEPGPGPRSLSQIAGELEALISMAELAMPAVLVGHSFGGLSALYFASRFPEQVAGLVLVDSMHPEQFERFAAAGIEIPTDPARLRVEADPRALVRGVPMRFRPLAYRLASRDEARSALSDELRSVPSSIEELRAAGLPQVPARLLIHGRRDWDRVTPDGRMEAIWRDLQGSLAEALGANEPKVARGSGHGIPLEQPLAIVAEVRALLAALRGDAGP